MMIQTSTIHILGAITLAFCLSACSADTNETPQTEGKLTSFTVKSQLLPMNGEPRVRISIDGSQFIQGDMIRLKAVTPYDHSSDQTHNAEFGESTWGGTVDNYFLLRCLDASVGDGWTSWTNTGFSKEAQLDLNGDGYLGDTSAPSLQYLSQQTPYVFTANTWNRSVGFKAKTKWRTIYKSTFYADQSIKENFQASDLLWAQTITQTCTDQVTLSFHHVLSELLITLPEGMNPTVTLEQMPDVDKQEFVVGDLYANTAYDYKSDPLSFNRISYTTDPALSGKVIGISAIKDDAYQLVKLSDITSTCTYVAYKVDNTHFRVIVPPMTFNENATIVVRDVNANGEATKYVYNLKDEIASNTFVANTCYPISLTKN